MRTLGLIAATAACALTMATGAAAALVFTTLDFPGAVVTNAQSINAQGDVVGTYTDPAGVQHGFLWSGKQYRIIDVPNALATFPRGIDASGDIVGTYQRQGEPGRLYGFLLTRRGGLQADSSAHSGRRHYPRLLSRYRHDRNDARNDVPSRVLRHGHVDGDEQRHDTGRRIHGRTLH